MCQNYSALRRGIARHEGARFLPRQGLRWPAALGKCFVELAVEDRPWVILKRIKLLGQTEHHRMSMVSDVRIINPIWAGDSVP